MYLFTDCESKWVCTECGNPAPPGYHEMANSKVAEAIAKMEEEGLTPAKCEKFLKTYSKVLHPHHAHMLDVKFSLLNLLGHCEGATMSQLTEEQLERKESLARTFLEVASKILPGISRLKGSALFELYLVMQQRGGLITGSSAYTHRRPLPLTPPRIGMLVRTMVLWIQHNVFIDPSNLPSTNIFVNMCPNFNL